ncbi:efflux RND transporter periplasmic adaptor subunit [Nitratidesulfovibrio sp. SRB-5]|uniref:efflux RND transporter periplasmic adaptor subunit n=1 Tax=Nitratidesulfovibrio sp. SRB-5 TaxID=2872636 RepID=UPI001027486A|nr:efflux RND transporter periplasmic adaptor subunit [Nitratidesulfovibrio sp. SRB-5]MBZ2170709.1 efflux RND transporter periplasmic adaptor subunit [Nitratidesulfovibrio sp. SRB-5]RXF76925.1 efflux RND transporter periplasmic adaptor subunit [Desulfovibrio sp. DS-1]
MRNTMRHALVALFAVLATVVAGCGQDRPAAGPAPEPEATVVTIRPGTVTLSTILPGRTAALLVSEVRPQVGGIIQKRLFREGADVKEGEVLYQIDPATFQAAYDSAKAVLARAEAAVEPARLKAARYADLVKTNGVSQQDNDDAQAAYKQYVAEVASARAALETARINLGYTRVVAPISGRIGRSSVTPGALVTANQANALATVQKTDPAYVDVTQSTGELLRLRRALAEGRLRKAGTDGAKVKLLFEDGSAYPLEGTLQFSDITVDPDTSVVTLRALFPNPKRDLLPGLYVRAVLEEGVDENAILVPQAAVTRDSKGNPMVLLVTADNTVERRSITVDRVVGSDWLVGSGLAAGDRVIVEGLQKVRPGGKVKATEAVAADASAASGQAPGTAATPAARQ